MSADYILENVDFSGDGWKFAIPVALMAIDFLTGIIHAWATGHLKSYKMREGLQKKFAEVSILVIGVLFECGFGLPAYILSGFSMYIIFMEMISICENLKKMGVPIPAFVERAFRFSESFDDKATEKAVKGLKKSKKE